MCSCIFIRTGPDKEKFEVSRTISDIFRHIGPILDGRLAVWSVDEVG